MISIITAFFTRDLEILNKPDVIWGIYCTIFIIVFLESAFLPTVFLPGDTTILLAGNLANNGILSFYPTLVLLVIATGTGYWINYSLGTHLGKTRLVSNWINGVSKKHYQRALFISNKYGSFTLFVGRFLGFVRTLLPLLAGISGFKLSRFQFVNWLSALLWVYTLMMTGAGITDMPFFRQNETLGIALLLIISIVILVVGVLGSVIIIIRRKKL